MSVAVLTGKPSSHESARPWSKALGQASDRPTIIHVGQRHHPR
jgi:hypothetical protein